MGADFLAATVLLGFAIFMMLFGYSDWKGVETGFLMSTKRMGFVIFLLGVILTFGGWILMQSVHYNEVDKLTRALYDNNITVKGYEETNKNYKITDFSKGLKWF